MLTNYDRHMCSGCLDEYGAWDALPANDEMRRVAGLVDALYHSEDCGSGGPLHVVTDDFNIEDDILHVYEGWRGPSEIVALAERIIEGLRPMSLGQRAATIGIAHHMMNPDDPGPNARYAESS